MLPEEDLDAIAGFIWTELTNAATDGTSEFRHAQLATIGAQGWPQSRTIILRHADTQRREVGFHTDRRSTKAAELAINTSVAVVAYDRPRGLQLRLWGQAELYFDDSRTEQIWAALFPPLRTPYRDQYAPGTPLDTPIVADPSDNARNPANPDAGFENFAFVTIRVVRLEWLHLRPTGHRRARFEWDAGWQGNWLAP
jgi:hypothetical protein